MNDQKPIAAVSATRMLDVLGTSKLIADAIAAADADVAARRQIAARDMALLEKNAFRDNGKLRAAVDDAVAAQRLAETALWQAKLAVDAAVRAKSAANTTFISQHDALEAELRASAAPEIAAFIREMWAELQHPPQPTVYGGESTRNAVTGRRTHSLQSNWKAINARLEAMREALHRAEEMQLDPDQSDVPERLARLRATLPGIGL